MGLGMPETRLVVPRMVLIEGGTGLVAAEAGPFAVGSELLPDHTWFREAPMRLSPVEA
jgi:hypothetical protein